MYWFEPSLENHAPQIDLVHKLPHFLGLIWVLASSDTFNWRTQGSIPGYVCDTKLPTLLNKECVGSSYTPLLHILCFFFFIVQPSTSQTKRLIVMLQNCPPLLVPFAASSLSCPTFYSIFQISKRITLWHYIIFKIILPTQEPPKCTPNILALVCFSNHLAHQPFWILSCTLHVLLS